MKDSLKEKRLRRLEKIKTSLESEITRFGWIRDKRGLRYLPTEQYLRMEAYTEAMNYIKW